jgi:hypothetical protein
MDILEFEGVSGEFRHMASALLPSRNIKSLKGANHEDATRHNVQESSGAPDQAKSHNLQTLRRPDLFIELPQSASRSPWSKDALIIAKRTRSGT